MSDAKKSDSTAEQSSDVPADTVVRKPIRARAQGGGIFALRRPIPQWLSILLGLLCILAVLGIWWFLTRGPTPEDRILSYHKIPSPAETFAEEQLHRLWYDSALTRNLIVTLRRVVLGFALAAAVAIPLGILCGCFPWVNSLLAPMNVFGRNIPIAALIPLTYALFQTGERQKVMFIFIACVAFVMMDTASAIADVSGRYIDTAFTLGASRGQIILKVLVPLAMPRVFNSLRLLFGLAFGYIMLSESIVEAGEFGGIGNIINVSKRRGVQEPIYLLLVIIPAVALVIDRTLYMVQRSLFPYQYDSRGVLHDLWRGLMHGVERVKYLFVSAQPLDPAQKAVLAAGKSS